MSMTNHCFEGTLIGPLGQELEDYYQHKLFSKTAVAVYLNKKGLVWNLLLTPQFGASQSTHKYLEVRKL